MDANENRGCTPRVAVTAELSKPDHHDRECPLINPCHGDLGHDDFFARLSCDSDSRRASSIFVCIHLLCCTVSGLDIARQIKPH